MDHNISPWKTNYSIGLILASAKANGCQDGIVLNVKHARLPSVLGCQVFPVGSSLAARRVPQVQCWEQTLPGVAPLAAILQC